MIKTLFFDLGGVVMTITQEVALRRFQALGLASAETYLDAYTQKGLFGDLEGGKIDDEQFRIELSRLVGRALTWDECQQAWLGYRGEVPVEKLQKIQELRKKGYRVVLTSNTNPYMMAWAENGDFDGMGNPITHYFDALYCSYRLRAMKPSNDFFMRILQAEQTFPDNVLFIDDSARNVAAASQMGIHTILAENGSDWAQLVEDYLAKK